MLPAVALKSSLRLAKFSTWVVVASAGKGLTGAVEDFVSADFVDPCGALGGDAPFVKSSAASGAATIKRPTQTARRRKKAIMQLSTFISSQCFDSAGCARSQWISPL